MKPNATRMKAGGVSRWVTRMRAIKPTPTPSTAVRARRSQGRDARMYRPVTSATANHAAATGQRTTKNQLAPVSMPWL
jgi:hypothetical protein